MKKVNNANESFFFRILKKAILKNLIPVFLLLFCGTAFNPGLYAADDDITSDQR